MKRNRILSVSLLGFALLLSACNKGGEAGPKDSHNVSKEQYDQIITDCGFAINNNVTYSGTFAMGAMSVEGQVEIDDNVIHAVSSGELGFDNYIKLDLDSLTDEGLVDVEVYSIELGTTSGRYQETTMPLQYAVTQSTYMVFLDYEDLTYDADNGIYSLKDTVEVDAPDDNMVVTDAKLQFNDGQLTSYKFKYSPKSNPLMALEADLKAEKQGTTEAEFPVVVEVGETNFNRSVYQRVFFGFKNGNATIDAKIDDRGTKKNKNVKFDRNAVEFFETVVDGDSSHHFVEFETDSYVEATDAIDGSMYYENTDGTWYTMPYSWTYGSYLTVLSYLIPVQFNKVEFADGVYKTKEAFDYTIGGEEFTIGECTYTFLYGDLQSYTLLAYEKGHVGEEEYKLSVEVSVSDYENTEVSLPK